MENYKTFEGSIQPILSPFNFPLDRLKNFEYHVVERRKNFKSYQHAKNERIRSDQYPILAEFAWNRRYKRKALIYFCSTAKVFYDAFSWHSFNEMKNEIDEYFYWLL